MYQPKTSRTIRETSYDAKNNTLLLTFENNPKIVKGIGILSSHRSTIYSENENVYHSLLEPTPEKIGALKKVMKRFRFEMPEGFSF